MGALCDEALTRLASPVNGYQQRGDRCEGLYGKQVAGTSLFLASFTQFFENFDLQSPDSLTVSWPRSVTGSDVSLRAETIRRGRYYRMDTRRAAKAGSYRWSSRLLSTERIARRDLGVVGWIDTTIGDSRRQVVIPLAIRQRQTPQACATYDLVLMPGERLTEIYLSLAPLTQEGIAGEYLKKDEPLRRGFYPAETPVAIHLPRSSFPTPGPYYLKIAARLGNGGTTAKEYTILASPDSSCTS